MSGKRILALFDVDGTLTAPRLVSGRHMHPARSRCAVSLAHVTSPNRVSGGAESEAGYAGHSG